MMYFELLKHSIQIMELVLNKLNTTKDYDTVYLLVVYLCIYSLASAYLSMASIL